MDGEVKTAIPSRRITEDQLQILSNEYNILHLIYFRSKNQHRQSIWWKYLNILHRQIRNIMKLSVDSLRIKPSKQDKISHKCHQIDNLVHYLLKKIFRKAYFEFNNIITLGQFISLGFTLVGLLSKLYTILIDISGQKGDKSLDQLKLAMSSTIEKTLKVTGVSYIGDDDLGEEIILEDVLVDNPKKRKAEEEEEEEEDVNGKVNVDVKVNDNNDKSKPKSDIPSRTTSTINKANKKIKKKKSNNYGQNSSSSKSKKSSKKTIDDIFGL
ncbi:hypothetical protein DFJ63DRAFT_56977 [Scheffersomyces coipomensis]|uniref:uncharacterized protein n=1 Tax=Scheffersomyces coipomensis TaxID=1788519 RepID=UPI00315D5B37